MEKGTGLLVIAGACLLVLFMVAVKHKTEFFSGFLSADGYGRDLHLWIESFAGNVGDFMRGGN